MKNISEFGFELSHTHSSAISFGYFGNVPSKNNNVKKFP